MSIAGHPRDVGAARDPGRSGPASIAVAIVFLAAAVAGASGVGTPVTEPLVAGLRSYVTSLAEAHYALQQANSYVNAEGDAEFALLTTRGANAEMVADFAAQAGWKVRDSLVSGWFVVQAPAIDDDALARLRAQPFTRVALRNRGIWICH